MSAATAQASNGGSDAQTSLDAVLKAAGPIVSCVLLQHIRKSGRDSHPHAAVSSPEKEPHEQHAGKTSQAKREVLVELIEQVEVDTTPQTNGVEKALGGPFTFLGQYPQQGVVLMARSDQVADLDAIGSMSIKELRALYKQTEGAPMPLEKSDLILSVREAQLPVNPHKLQPPFHDLTVRGDILLMRVGGDEEEEEDDIDTNQDETSEAAMSKAIDDFTKATAVPNEEFFLNYTKDEYVAFASRTDIAIPKDEPVEDDDDSSGDEEEHLHDGEDGEDEEEDDDFVPGAEDCDEEQEKHALLNLILGEVLKKFREENGRGPDSEELLDLRRQVADKLGLVLEEPKLSPDSKRKAADPHSPPSPKKVKFTVKEDAKPPPQPVDNGEVKPAAKPDESPVEVSENNGEDTEE